MTSIKMFFSMMVLLMVAGSTAMTQVTPPALINYPGVLRDRTTGQPVNSSVDLLFTFCSDPNSGPGTDILSATHTGVVVSGGLFSVQLGGGLMEDGFGPGFHTSLWEMMRDYSDVWMEIRAGAETMTPRVRVVGSPYAMNSTLLQGKRAADSIDTTGSLQTKTGILQVGELWSGYLDVGTITSFGLTDYGDMYVGANLQVDGPINANGGIVATGGISLPGSSALKFPDGSTISSGSPGRTPQQIATLHWYGAAEQSSFPVGPNPQGVAFDGSATWVTDNSSNVKKLRASDGSVLGTFPVGDNPSGVAFDGSSIWVANADSNSVSKL